DALRVDEQRGRNRQRADLRQRAVASRREGGAVAKAVEVGDREVRVREHHRAEAVLAAARHDLGGPVRRQRPDLDPAPVEPRAPPRAGSEWAQRARRSGSGRGGRGGGGGGGAGARGAGGAGRRRGARRGAGGGWSRGAARGGRSSPTPPPPPGAAGGAAPAAN